MRFIIVKGQSQSNIIIIIKNCMNDSIFSIWNYINENILIKHP